MPGQKGALEQSNIGVVEYWGKHHSSVVSLKSGDLFIRHSGPVEDRVILPRGGNDDGGIALVLEFLRHYFSL